MALVSSVVDHTYMGLYTWCYSVYILHIYESDTHPLIDSIVIDQELIGWWG
jgi:hypothetical protein